MINIIVAMDLKNTIGKDNQLPWYIPSDLKHFKKITTGHTIVMGRKTFESIGKPLPNRDNIILTKNENYVVKGCMVCNSIEEIFSLSKDKEIFIIGGAEIYKIFLPYTDKLYITLIHDKFDGDTFFPRIKFSEWELIELIAPKPENNYVFDFQIHKKL